MRTRSSSERGLPLSATMNTTLLPMTSAVKATKGPVPMRTSGDFVRLTGLDLPLDSSAAQAA